MTERQHIALDPVAAHLNRKAQFFENEALILAGQVRDLLALVPQDAPAPEPEEQAEELRDELSQSWEGEFPHLERALED